MEWQVWDVDPHLAKFPNRRREQHALPSDRRTGSERRARTRIAALPGLERGWLCFAAGARKLRLVSAPDDWETLPDRKLDLLRRLARPELKPRS